MVTIGFSFILIPAWGYIGAGVVASLSYGFTALIVLVFFLKRSELKIGFLVPKMDEILLIISQLKKHFNLNKE